MIKGKKGRTVNIFTPLPFTPPLSSAPTALLSSAVLLRKDIYKPQAKPNKVKVLAKEKKFNLVWYLYYKWFKTLPL